MKSIATAVAVLALTSACSGGGDDESAQRAFDQTCSFVRSGVAAFNENDVATTIERFQAALDPARRLADTTDDERADDLLEAVEYYAELPADQYREAFESSPDFKKYQATTLGQCGDAQPEDSPERDAET